MTAQKRRYQHISIPLSVWFPRYDNPDGTSPKKNNGSASLSEIIKFCKANRVGAWIHDEFGFTMGRVEPDGKYCINGIN